MFQARTPVLPKNSPTIESSCPEPPGIECFYPIQLRMSQLLRTLSNACCEADGRREQSAQISSEMGV